VVAACDEDQVGMPCCCADVRVATSMAKMMAKNFIVAVWIDLLVLMMLNRLVY